MMKNFGNMMKQAQEMQKKMQDMQAELEQMTVEGQAGGGMVKTVVTGKGLVQSLKIDPSLIDKEEADMLEDLVVAAINDGKAKADQKAADEMGKLTGGMKLPGGMNLPF